MIRRIIVDVCPKCGTPITQVRRDAGTYGARRVDDPHTCPVPTEEAW